VRTSRVPRCDTLPDAVVATGNDATSAPSGEGQPRRTVEPRVSTTRARRNLDLESG